jgi:8-oxo-dGTP pyrophosphatase MutT (NUDIX family)
MSAEPKPSATVVVIRDTGSTLEVLLLERSGERRPWVFPGGKLDRADWAGGADADAAARHAAVRESREEAGLALEAAALVPISRWITPEIAPRRFDTLFFLARIEPAVEVCVDGGEIASYRWFVPRVALEAHHAAEIRLAPPTFVTVSWLVDHADAAAAAEALGRESLITFRPRVHAIEGGACILYPGDAGYESGDIEIPGSRHRLWTQPDGWRYERA